MADKRSKSEDLIPQVDKQAHTELAQREGEEGEQAKMINQQETEQRKKD